MCSILKTGEFVVAKAFVDYSPLPWMTLMHLGFDSQKLMSQGIHSSPACHKTLCRPKLHLIIRWVRSHKRKQVEQLLAAGQSKAHRLVCLANEGTAMNEAVYFLRRQIILCLDPAGKRLFQLHSQYLAPRLNVWVEVTRDLGLDPGVRKQRRSYTAPSAFSPIF